LALLLCHNYYSEVVIEKRLMMLPDRDTDAYLHLDEYVP
jgi:hypothetical protein